MSHGFLKNLDVSSRLDSKSRIRMPKAVRSDIVQVRAVLKKGKKSGTFTLVESAPAFPGFTAMRETRNIRVVK